MNEITSFSELQDYFDSKDKKESVEYSLERNDGIIDFAKRVYEAGRSKIKEDPVKYIRFASIAFDNIMEFLSVRYPRIEDHEERKKCANLISDFLQTMSKEIHYITRFYYVETQKYSSWILKNYESVEKLGIPAFYHTIESFSWNRMNHSFGDKYARFYFEYFLEKYPLNGDWSIHPPVTQFFMKENLFPYVTIKDRNNMEINVPLFEDCFDGRAFEEDHFSTEVYQKTWDGYDRCDLIIVPGFARLIPNTMYDTVGQFGDYDLSVNYASDNFRYSAIIQWCRNWKKPVVLKYSLSLFHNKPSSSQATLFTVPYPEILDLDELKKAFPILVNPKSDHLTASDGKFTSLNEKIREIGYQKSIDRSTTLTNYFDSYMEDSNKKNGLLFETPSVSPDILFYPLKNLQKKKIRTVFISLYRIGSSKTIIENLQKLVHDGAYVYAYVEPTARGDEKANQKIIKDLEKFGVNVCHSCGGLKVHMKAWLIIYQDNSMLGMVGTGNFNLTTLREYVDLHYITKNDKICRELLYTFKTLFSGGNFKSDYEFFTHPNRNIVITPIAARGRIQSEISKVMKDGSPIFIKCNNLTDSRTSPMLIDAAANYYCPLRMMIRTSTIVPPSVKEISVRSKVSQYLEHSRIYIFGDNVYISSADLMKRNLDRRLEIFLKIPESYRDLKVITSNSFSEESFVSYIDRTWDSCNYSMDFLTMKWKMRGKSK